MGQGTKIEWVANEAGRGHTHNPWHGCTRRTASCNNCYAETFSHRLGRDIWGPTARRKFFNEAHHLEPRLWHQRAIRAGIRARVFCASMCDVFEQLPSGHPDDGRMSQERERLWETIEDTDALDWLMLTKRPENVAAMVPRQWLDTWPPHVWLGTSVGHNDERHLLDYLLAVPAPIGIRWLSAEPLHGPLDVRAWLGRDRISWVVTGAESGHGARPMHEAWVASLRDQCAEAGCAFFYKQKLDARGHKVSLPVLDGRQHAAWPDAP